MFNALKISKSFPGSLHCFDMKNMGCIMSQSVPTGYILPGQPPGKFFSASEPGHQGKFFCLIPCPGAKK